ncbi:MAG: DMT family transporter [Anaerolineales bacterium]
MRAYMYLMVAILTEVAASTALRATKGFTQFWPSVVTVIGYAISFYALSHTLTLIKLGIAYAMWSGIGMILITILGFLIYRQRLDLPALAGIALIILGVVVIQLFSTESVLQE